MYTYTCKGFTVLLQYYNIVVVPIIDLEFLIQLHAYSYNAFIESMHVVQVINLLSVCFIHNIMYIHDSGTITVPIVWRPHNYIVRHV